MTGACTVVGGRRAGLPSPAGGRRRAAAVIVVVLVDFLVAAAVATALAARAPAGPPDLETVREELMRPSQVVAPAAIEREGLAGRVLCGYQGWFTTGDDGAGLGWRHWRRRDPAAPGGTRFAVDMLPDVSELPPGERFATAAVGADGRPLEVFSSHLRPTVLRHFRWMRDYGIDGVFVQRFVTHLAEPKLLAHDTKLLADCRDGALENGRVYAVMYDLSGVPPGGLGAALEDWRRLRGRMKIGADAAALHLRGRPLVAVWGLGFADRPDYPTAECRALIEGFKADGCAVMCGVPTGWRTLTRDARPNADLPGIAALCDVVSPWTVGRYATPDDVRRHADRDWSADIAWCRERGVDYLPVVFPGFSWHNLHGGRLDQIPRLRGRLLWTQAVEARRAGARGVYVAMFDEVDEATAIFKCIDPPTPALAGQFVGMEGLPSDFYLRLAGEIGRLFRGERSASAEPPR